MVVDPSVASLKMQANGLSVFSLWLLRNHCNWTSVYFCSSFCNLMLPGAVCFPYLFQDGLQPLTVKSVLTTCPCFGLCMKVAAFCRQGTTLWNKSTQGQTSPIQDNSKQVGIDCIETQITKELDVEYECQDNKNKSYSVGKYGSLCQVKRQIFMFNWGGLCYTSVYSISEHPHMVSLCTHTFFCHFNDGCSIDLIYI